VLPGVLARAWAKARVVLFVSLLLLLPLLPAVFMCVT